jgi:hypothetical protein
MSEEDCLASGPSGEPKRDRLPAKPGFARREPKRALRWHAKKKAATWGKHGFPRESEPKASDGHDGTVAVG